MDFAAAIPQAEHAKIATKVPLAPPANQAKETPLRQQDQFIFHAIVPPSIFFGRQVFRKKDGDAARRKQQVELKEEGWNRKPP